jgi:hypothetical protein
MTYDRYQDGAEQLTAASIASYKRARAAYEARAGLAAGSDPATDPAFNPANVDRDDAPAIPCQCRGAGLGCLREPRTSNVQVTEGAGPR